MTYYQTIEKAIIRIYSKFGHKHNAEHRNISIRRSIANALRYNYGMDYQVIKELISVGRKKPYHYVTMYNLVNPKNYDKKYDDFYNSINKVISGALDKFLKDI